MVGRAACHPATMLRQSEADLSPRLMMEEVFERIKLAEKFGGIGRFRPEQRAAQAYAAEFARRLVWC